MSELVNRSRIAEYWMDKFINMETAEIISGKEWEKQKDHIKAEIIVTDPGEPYCWACNAPAFSEEYADKGTFKQKWDNEHTRSILQRCHIVGRQFGGSDEPENLFLMCDACHEESPDTDNPENFFRWVIERRKKGSRVDDRINEFMRALEIKGVDLDVMEGFFTKNKIDYNKVLKEAQGRSGLHQFSVSDSSVHYAFADVCTELITGKLDIAEYQRT